MADSLLKSISRFDTQNCDEGALFYLFPCIARGLHYFVTFDHLSIKKLSVINFYSQVHDLATYMQLILIGIFPSIPNSVRRPRRQFASDPHPISEATKQHFSSTAGHFLGREQRDSGFCSGIFDTDKFDDPVAQRRIEELRHIYEERRHSKNEAGQSSLSGELDEELLYEGFAGIIALITGRLDIMSLQLTNPFHGEHDEGDWKHRYLNVRCCT